MSNDRKISAQLTPAAEMALANIKERTYGTQGVDEAVSRALVVYWQIMEAQGQGEELRTRTVGATGRTKRFVLASDKVPKRYVR
ncbi:hypothetical protein [Streptomyces scopuliridis]|uniref:hypothetical protein n=1 Tax=Streptomyces scopuliridis TaxID=452529 RepID=UPI0035D9F007